MAQTRAAEIGRALGALATACRADPSAAGDRCLTLSGPQGSWIQVIRGPGTTVNVAYTGAVEPGQRLRDLLLRLPGLEVTAWERGTYATFAAAAVPDEVLIAFLDGVFERVLACPVGAVLEWKVEEL